MIDRKAVFAGVRAELEADYPELAHQVPHWIDIAERAFGVRVDAIEERARALGASATPASDAQVADAAQNVARLSLVDVAARWQRGV